MKKKTFVVLKPQANTYPTIYITTDQKHAFEVFEASTVQLEVGELKIKNEDVQEIIDIFNKEWIDINDYKVPVFETKSGFEHISLTVDEFLTAITNYPEIMDKLIARNYWVDYPDTVKSLDCELYEFFQNLELANR